jgi:hypothetical protein
MGTNQSAVLDGFQLFYEELIPSKPITRVRRRLDNRNK